MKNYSTMVIALMVAFTLSSLTASANNEGKDKDNEIPGLEFKYIGDKENQPVFLLQLVSSEEDEYTISFRDRQGHILYTDRLKGTRISKRFLLNTAEIGTNEVSVEIRSKKNNQVELYKIGTSQSIVTETVLNRIN